MKKPTKQKEEIGPQETGPLMKAHLDWLKKHRPSGNDLPPITSVAGGTPRSKFVSGPGKVLTKTSYKN